jgi:hypothetical protein
LQPGQNIASCRPCHAIEIEISHHINISSATVFTLHEKAFNANAVFLKVPFDYRDFFGQFVALIAKRAQAFHGNDFPRFILDNYWGTYSDRAGPF